MSTEQLAQALRDIAEHRMSMYGNDDFFHLKKIARTALAVYELEKAQVVQDDDFVLVRRGVLGSACYAIRNGSPAPKTLEALRAAAMQGAAPAAPVAVPLTDEELRDALRQCPHDAVENLRVRWLYATDFARTIERTLAARWGVNLEGGQE